MPLERVPSFPYAWTCGCFLVLGYCCRGLSFHHSFIRGNSPFLSAQKVSHRHRVSLPSPLQKYRAAFFFFFLLQLNLAYLSVAIEFGQGTRGKLCAAVQGTLRVVHLPDSTACLATSYLQFIDVSFCFRKRSYCTSSQV